MSDNVYPIDQSGAGNIAQAEERFTEFTQSLPIKYVYCRARDEDVTWEFRGGYAQASDELVAVLADHELTQGQLLELAIAAREMYDALQVIGRTERVISDES